MTTQHTPTPWRMSSMRNGETIQIVQAYAPVARIALVSPRKPENAAFIVRACNAHDELVAALRCIDAALNQNKTFPADVELARAECRAALAKVSK